MAVLARGPLSRSVAETATDLWNDSCGVAELEVRDRHRRGRRDGQPDDRPRRLEGATRRPGGRRPAIWPPRIPAWTEVDLAWAHRRGHVAARGAAPAAGLRALRRSPGPAVDADEPDASGGRPTRCSPRAIRFDGLAPNIIVKFPATAVGIGVMEEATYRGVSVNCTVSFSVSQAVAAAEAVERGLRRREADGLPVDRMGPVITIMMGRIEDWLRVQTERDGIVVDPAALAWSGVAVFKRAYGIFRERGLRARLLGAAIRHHYHWSELIGGDVVITLPPVWQRRFNASDVEVRPRMDDPVAAGYRRRAVPATCPTSCGPTSPTGWPSPSSTPSRRPSARFGRSSPRTTSCSPRSSTRSCPNPDRRA